MNYTAPDIFLILMSCGSDILYGSNDMIGGEDLDFTEPI